MLFAWMCVSTGSIHAADDQIVTIDIVHTNDIHGRSSYVKQSVIGFEKLKTWMQTVQPDFVVDAGDVLHGQAFATLEEGESIAELMKAVGYDAITPGNHDWNYGKERLLELQNVFGGKILAANVSEDGNAYFQNDGYIIKEIDGVKVGLFGVFDQELKEDTAPRNVAGLSFANDAQTANALVDELKAQGCEVIVALSHQAYLPEFVAQTKGIDALIAGHEHASIDEAYPDAQGNLVKVVETGCYLENAGVLTITYNQSTGEIQSIDETLLSVKQAESIAGDDVVLSSIAKINQRQSAIFARTVGTTGVMLDGSWESLRIAQTGLGSVVATAYLQETGADVAFENAGGIRIGRTLQPGAITYRDLIDISPFGNYIVTKQLSGAAIQSLIEDSVELGLENNKAYDEWKKTGSSQTRWPDNNGSYLQFAGVQATIDVSKPYGSRVQALSIKGTAVDPTKQYIVATNNYIALGKAYSQLAKQPELHQYAACDEALIRYFANEEAIINLAATTQTMIYTEDKPVVEEEKKEPSPIIKDTGAMTFDITGALIAGLLGLGLIKRKVSRQQ